MINKIKEAFSMHFFKLPLKDAIKKGKYAAKVLTIQPGAPKGILGWQCWWTYMVDQSVDRWRTHDH